MTHFKCSVFYLSCFSGLKWCVMLISLNKFQCAEQSPCLHHFFSRGRQKSADIDPFYDGRKRHRGYWGVAALSFCPGLSWGVSSGRILQRENTNTAKWRLETKDRWGLRVQRRNYWGASRSHPWDVWRNMMDCKKNTELCVMTHNI